jgi:hypothetical protein
MGRYGDESGKSAKDTADATNDASHTHDAASTGVTSADSNAKRNDAADTLPKSLDRWKAWPQISAIAHDNLFAVNADWMDRPAPRIADGAAQMCADLDAARAHLGK